ncbi:transmembrane regulator [Bordetella trematum]|nr:transmembrane regulator [Bordetella trematum]
MTLDAKPSPITEDDLHAWVDGQLDPARTDALRAYLADHPEQARRVQAWQAQRLALRARFAGVLDEPIPDRLRQAASPPRTVRASQGLWRLAASLLIALAGGVLGWGLRAQWPQPPLLANAAPNTAGAFALRAAVAHTVFVPDLRRPVEISADHEDQLVTWLSKRMGARLTPPDCKRSATACRAGGCCPAARGRWHSSCTKMLPACG